jgi:hypothetical protein
MLLGILSDTHGWLHPTLPQVLAGVDLILHAGDIGTRAVLDQLEQIAPVRAVWGNIDGVDLRCRLPEHQHFSLAGVSFWMTHIAGRPGRWQQGMGAKLRAAPPQVFVCGHSHILQITRVPDFGGMLFLNPGAAGREGFHRVKTCMRLHLDGGRLHQAEVVHLEEGRTNFNVSPPGLDGALL